MHSRPSIEVSACRFSVAPMMDWTDTHCRSFHRVLAPNVRLYTEMVHAQAVRLGDRGKLLGFDTSEHPVALQLGGSDPTSLAEAARIGEQQGYDEINLNVGCPSDRVQAGRFGACLMREPDLVAECVSAMSAAVRIPVTVKCRLGVDEDEEYTRFRDFIDRVADSGCRHFVVHARKAWLQGLSPKENREIPPLRYEWVHALKRERAPLQIVINGGITRVEQVSEQLDAGLDGVMLGRAAYHEPYLLHQLDHRLFGTPLRSRAELLLDYRAYVERQLERGIALKHISRHVLGLFHAQAGGRAFRQHLSQHAHLPGADWSVIEQALQLTRWEHAA